MNIYSQTTTSFNNNGLGFLTDVVKATVIDALNGDYSLELEYIRTGHLSEYLVEGNIIKCKVADSSFQLFRIKTVRKNFKTIKITAKHIFYDLIDNFLEDVYPQNLNGQTFLDHILNHTVFNHNFTGYSDITSLFSARYVRRNPVEALIGDIDNSMINITGGEIKRDNFNINLLSRVGNNNGVKLLFGKNITGIDISIDITDLTTRVMPQGYDGLLLPEKYVDSPLINTFPTPKIRKIEFDNIKYDPDPRVDAYHNINDAYQALRDAVNELYDSGLDKPQINISINWIELSKTNEYKNFANLETVNIGDTITAYVLGMNYETRVIQTTYDVLKDRITNFQIGTWNPTFTNSMNKLIKKVNKIEPNSLLAQAKASATELITSAMGGYIYKTQSELYIMDTDNPSTAQKVWRWNINGLGYSSTGINGPYGIAMTMDGSIVADFITSGTLNTSLIEGYDALIVQVEDQTGNISRISQTVNDLNIKIGNITNTGVSASSDVGVVSLENVNASFPMQIKIKPLGEDISYLYPSDSLYPSDILYPKDRRLKFTNITTNEVWYYELPEDLLYYDENNYDEFILDFGNGIDKIVNVNKKCQHTAVNGVNTLLSEEEVHEYEYPDSLNLSTGDYTVELLGYDNAYLFVQLMASNIYTTQFATTVELNQKYFDLTISKVGVDEVIARINASEEGILIEASKVNIKGVITAINNDSTTTIDGGKITTNSITANQVASDIITTSNISAQSINASQISTGTLNGNNVNITNINASNITSGTISGDKIRGGTITGTTISGDVINGGTINGDSVSLTNINANNITSGTISGASISVGSSNYYLRMGRTWTKHPEVSGLNVGGGGINLNGNDIQAPRKIVATSTALLLCSTADSVKIGNTNSLNSTAPIEVYQSKCYANQYFEVTTVNHYVRKSNGNRISLSAYINEGSSRKIKENIQPIDSSFVDVLYNEVKELKLYSYDYKKSYMEEDRFNKYGFMIDDVEDKNISKLLDIETGKNYSLYSGKGLAKLDLILIKELMKKIDDLERRLNNEQTI